MRRVNKIHLGICIAYWLLWAVGIILLVIRRGDNAFFWQISEPYNRAVLVCSVIPVEPVFFAVSALKGFARKQPFRHHLFGIILFVSNAVVWLAYISLFIMMTGGV